MNFKMMVLSSVTASLGACTDRPVEIPGDLSNPKLAELINASMQQEVTRMAPGFAREYIPQAGANARLWLKDIDEVVARCRFGPDNHSRFNLFEYDIKLATGEKLLSVFSSRRCSYSMHVPLVMRAKFESGESIGVLTDGRERQHPIDMARPDIQAFAETILGVDLRRNPSRYLQPEKTAKQIADEWASPARTDR